MSAWLALLPAATGDLSAVAGEAVLCAWLDAPRRPHPQARRCDPGVLDADGAPATASLLWPDRMPLFDDPAVVQARRSAHAGPRPRCVTTLTVDSRHFAGSLWAPGPHGRVEDDPFRLVGRPRVLQVGPGLLAAASALVGPAQERWAGAPWPGRA